MRSSARFLLLILISDGLASCTSFTAASQSSSRTRVVPIHHRQQRLQQLSVAADAKLEEDTLERYAVDVAKVLKDLRGDAVDPSIPANFRNRKSSFTNIWTLEMWDRHTARWRYIRCILSLPNSRLLRRIFPQLAVLVLWSVLGIRYASNVVEIPLAPLSVMSTFVAFLLTLRSNQGLGRLNDGRLAWARAVFHTRDISHLVANYVYPKDKKLGLLMGRHISLFCWMLKSHMRDTNNDSLVHAMLPNPVDASYILSQRKRPVALTTRLRQCVAQLSEDNQLKVPQHNQLEKCISDLHNVIMLCEAIRATPIPPVYTHHASRLLIFYLALLPLSLQGTIANAWVTVVATAAVGFATLGLDEISHMLEQPFRLMPLYQLSKISMLDVADAMYCLPPSLDNDGNVEASVPLKPVYW